MGSEVDNSSSREDKSLEELSDRQKIVCLPDIPMKSESMPVLRCASSKEESSVDGNVTVGSESSLARQRKMKMIVARMCPHLSSESDLTLNTSPNTSKTDLTNENYEAKKLESKTELPILQDEKPDRSSCLKEVTLWEAADRQSAGRSRSSDSERYESLPNVTRITANPQESQTDDDLIDIAENPYPSIKSFYFPPNPQEKEGSSTGPRKHTRVTKNTDALLRIDGELGPLWHKLTEITSKFRALSMTVPSLISQRHYPSRTTNSSNVSSYYLHRAETFDRGSSINDVVYILGKRVPKFDRSSQESGGPNHAETLPSRSFNAETVSFTNDFFPVKKSHSKGTNISQKCSSKCVGRSVSNATNYWATNENSCVALQNSSGYYGGYVGNNLSGSLAPVDSGSCYKCMKNRALETRVPNAPFYFNQLDAIKSKHDCMKKRSTIHSTDELGPSNTDSSLDYKDCINDSQENTLEKSPESYAPPDIHVISVNTQLRTTVEKRYRGRIVAGGNSYQNEATNAQQSSTKDPKIIKNSSHNSHCPGDESISTSLTVIGTDGTNKTHYMNYTRVGSQSSLIISKKCQNVGASSREQTENSLHRSSTHLVARNKGPEKEKERKVRDLDVQCSGFDLNYRRNENLFRQSIESLLKPSGSDESTATRLTSSKTRSVQAPRGDEKVIIVPILFTDGIPEPSKVPLFNFARSRHRLHETSHRVVKLEKGASSITQNSRRSRTSSESCTTESYLTRKLMNREQWHSGMSLSCVSHEKTPSQMSNTIHTLSDRCRRTGKIRRPGSTDSESTVTNKAYSEPTKRGTKRVIQGMRSSPEDFLSDT